jgi:alkylation response protein AidB-like acyl-CoA dehydrogenase
MNFDDTPAEAKFRAEVRAWIQANAPKQHLAGLKRSGFGTALQIDEDPMVASRAWQKKKYEAGWACLHWPKEYGGRAATPIERVIWGQEEGDYAKLSGVFTIGHGMCGPTMMTYASEAANRELMPKMASGEDIWCQLFSEPAGGSDLAGLRTKAEKDGDDWVINGQKIWTSGAQHSEWGILITRTDTKVPKHKGLTMFFLNMKSPGVEIRPIRQMNEASGFNEVYFTNVRIPDSQRLGAVNDGWRVSLTTLMNERLSIGSGIQTGADDLFDFCTRLALPDGGLAIDDGRVRTKLANFITRSRGLRYTALRTISQLSKGEEPGPENSVHKLVAGLMVQDIAKFAMDLEGEAGMLLNMEDAPERARFQNMLMRSPAMRIEGGSDEILRNIIAERVLGLPQDVRVDKNVPFDKIPTSGRT